MAPIVTWAARRKVEIRQLFISGGVTCAERLGAPGANSRKGGEELVKLQRAGIGLSAAFLIVGSAKAELPDLTGGYQCRGHCGPRWTCATIKQDGVELNIANGLGDQTPGRFLSNSKIQATDWDDARGGILDGTILQDPIRVEWDNGTVWIMTDICPGP